ncbi:zinc finger protein 25-like [Sabethes cyaneus]|uniref:zinc finger protein 25-like n=1 Tax=Sabethes cyaneus TaxID=53552 RepID=UPI00237EE71C|nr:zinc finger protein 25-like [Sabethes cyaneus]
MNAEEIDVPSEDPHSYCRLCFGDRNLVPLLPGLSETHNMLLNQIIQFTGIQIDPENGLPASICWRCAVTLEDFQLFRQRSLHNDSIIRERYAAKYAIEFNVDPVEDELSNGDHMNAFTVDETNNQSNIDVDLVVPTVENHSVCDTDSVRNDYMQDTSTDQSCDAVMCHICKKQCRNKTHLYVHFKHQHSDAGRPFKCTICPASFKRKNHLEGHITSHGGDVKRYSCEECGANYAKGKSLRAHRQQMHGLPPVAPAKKCGELTNVYGPYSCTYCSKTFKHRPSLNFHIKSHYEMLPEACEFCNARFDNERGKLIHMGKYHPSDMYKKVLAPKETFQCAFCPRSFDQRNYLTQHTKYMHLQKIDEAEEGSDGDELNEPMNSTEPPVTIKFEVEEDSSLQSDWN